MTYDEDIEPFTPDELAEIERLKKEGWGGMLDETKAIETIYLHREMKRRLENERAFIKWFMEKKQ